MHQVSDCFVSGGWPSGCRVVQSGEPCIHLFVSTFLTSEVTHSEKSHIRRMKAWPYGQECGGHDPTKKESVLLMKLAHWHGVQVQTVKDRVQCIKL